MPLSRLPFTLCPALFAALSACSVQETTGFGGSGGQGGFQATPDNATVRFDEQGTITLAPGDVRTLGVLGEPAAPYQIAFTLLGTPLDASVNPPVTLAGAATGHAVVQLHAPSQSTTFHVRASLLDESGAPGASAERAVAVSDLGFASLRIHPTYGGHRPVTEWTASVVAVSSCTELAKTLPADPDGALTVTSPATYDPLIDNVPVGPTLAVVVRAGHFAWGCTDTAALTPGETMNVAVTVIDAPLDLGNASLVTTFDYAAGAPLLAPLFVDAAQLLGEGFLPSAGSKDGSVVLNAMAALVPAGSAGAFATQRIDKGWDAVAAKHFAAINPGLRERLKKWAVTGLAQQSPSFEAQLASGSPPTLTLIRFGDLDPAAAGAASSAPLTWSSQPKDTVLLSGSLTWEPTRFAGNAALGPAQQDVPGATTVPGALATLGDCDGLGEALGGFGSCDVACVGQLCTAALGARFGKALGASQDAAQLASIGVKGAADATVGDAAQPKSLTGQWIGDFESGALQVQVTGTLSPPTSPVP